MGVQLLTVPGVPPDLFTAPTRGEKILRRPENTYSLLDKAPPAFSLSYTSLSGTFFFGRMGEENEESGERVVER
jgi:hypothetical protein